MIPPETIRTIIETARIEEVISEFVNIKKKGVNYLGNCPFHNEKTPSFTVSPSKGIYKCFGCGKAGNVVNFIMEHEHLTYPESIRFLAKKYQVEIEEEPLKPEELEAINERESLFQVVAFASRFFTESLENTDEGKSIGLTYLNERGFTEQTLKKFQLGYSPVHRNALTESARKNGYKDIYLVKSGLSIERDGTLFDRFAGRVIFPILNLSGRVAGFGGRIMKEADSKAKYINSPESDIYNKSRILYGLYQARNTIVSKDNCYLTEGYTDVISLTQAGIGNVVSSSGTSLTVDQIRLIKRFTPNITLLFDGDEAGIKASLRGTDLILEEGMNVHIVVFPDQEDPDSFARKNRSSDVISFITGNARDFIRFKTTLLLKDMQNDPLQRATVIKEVVRTISLVPDPITRSLYTKECSGLLGIPENIVLLELNKLLRNKARQKFEPLRADDITGDLEDKPVQVLQSDYYNLEPLEKELVRIMLIYGTQEISVDKKLEDGYTYSHTYKLGEIIIQDLEADEIMLENETYRKMIAEFAEALKNEKLPDESYFIHHIDPAVTGCAVDLSTTTYMLSTNFEKKLGITTKLESDDLYKLVTNAILSYKSRRVDIMIRNLQSEIHLTNDESEITILKNREIELLNIRNKINRSDLGRVVLK